MYYVNVLGEACKCESRSMSLAVLLVAKYLVVLGTLATPRLSINRLVGCHIYVDQHSAD